MRREGPRGGRRAKFPRPDVNRTNERTDHEAPTVAGPCPGVAVGAGRTGDAGAPAAPAALR